MTYTGVKGLWFLPPQLRLRAVTWRGSPLLGTWGWTAWSSAGEAWKTLESSGCGRCQSLSPELLETEMVTSPRESSVLPSAVEEEEPSKPLDIRHWATEFVFFHVGFLLALIQWFLTVVSFFPLRIVIYILCHCVLEVCHFLFYFIGGYLRDWLKSQTWTFKQGWDWRTMGASEVQLNTFW